MNQRFEQPVFISIVVPVYRGEEYLLRLTREIFTLKNKLENENFPFQILECVFVDDDSKDNSSQILYNICSEFPWVQVISLSKNFGQHPATMAGILHSSGDWIATLDEDLQHPPRFIVDLLRKAVLETLDIVYANPEGFVHGNGFRDWSSKRFKKIIAWFTKNQNVNSFNSFRLIRGNIARAASAVSIQQTYFDIALGWFSVKVGNVYLPLVDERYITKKESGYSFIKLLSHAKRLVQSSEIKFLRFGALLGVFAILFGIFVSIYIFISKYFDPEFVVVRGWTSTVILISILGGINAFLTSLALEQISVILLHTHGKPKFFLVDRKSDELLKKWFKNRE